MIDTDKYEGHTPAPWEWIMDDKDTYLSCFVNDHHNNIEADEKLIADAPRLLAEVLRLREGIEKALIPTDTNPIIHPLVKLSDLRKALKEMIE